MPPTNVPTFLVVGAGRSGTTGLVEGLRTHPSVFVTAPKEPHYFAFHGQPAVFDGPGDDATVNRVAVTDREKYLELYADAGDSVARGDGSVTTLYYHDRAIPEILQVNPDMRIVIMLREPVDRAYSSYQYMSARGFEPEEHFADAFADDANRQKQNWQHLWHYESMSYYADAVSAFQASLPPEQVGIWFYDDLVADYELTVSEVLRFVGAPHVEGEAAGVPRVNISGTPKWAAAQRLVWLATRNEVIRRNVKRFTSYRLRELVRRANLKPSGVDAKVRAELAPLYADDLRRLSTLVDPVRQPGWLSAHRPDKGVDEASQSSARPEQSA
jgi:hypothetical protein